jgi:hypothetical protein
MRAKHLSRSSGEGAHRRVANAHTHVAKACRGLGCTCSCVVCDKFLPSATRHVCVFVCGKGGVRWIGAGLGVCVVHVCMCACASMCVRALVCMCACAHMCVCVRALVRASRPCAFAITTFCMVHPRRTHSH